MTRKPKGQETRQTLADAAIKSVKDRDSNFSKFPEPLFDLLREAGSRQKAKDTSPSKPAGSEAGELVAALGAEAGA